ncbi:MAG: hypothetical protein WAL31_02865 [Gaiellaceae bacterium]
MTMFALSIPFRDLETAATREPFVRLTGAPARVFPEHLPYDGAFEELTPHLTVAQGDDLDETEAAIAPDCRRENDRLTL